MEIEKIEEIIDLKYLLRFDGASRGNPGKAGAGAVLYLDNHEIWSTSTYIDKKQTNNYAEYVGVLVGLRGAINKGIRKLNVEGDSMLVVKQLTGEWKVKSDNLMNVYNKCMDLKSEFDEITFSHIYRDKNSRADELANLAIDSN